MLKSILPPSEQRTMTDFQPALKNPAVALCNEAWGKIFKAALDQKFDLDGAEHFAGEAYRRAIPPLSGYQNVCDFKACIGYGMLLGAIKPETGTKLLYAAQLALGAIPKKARTQKM